MRALLAVALAALATPAAAANVAECKAQLAASLTQPAFADQLAGAEGMAASATPAIKGSAVMLIDLDAAIRDRAAELAALKAQVARVQGIAAALADLRAKNPTSLHYIDAGADTALNTLLADLTARVTRVATQLDSERTALDQSLQFHCTAGAAPANAAAH